MSDFVSFRPGQGFPDSCHLSQSSVLRVPNLLFLRLTHFSLQDNPEPLGRVVWMVPSTGFRDFLA